MTDSDRSSPMSKEELQRMENVAGEVRIPLQEYHQLVRSATKYELSAQRYETAVDTIKRFLSFLRTREDVDMDSIIHDFNKESSNLTMYIDDTGKVRVSLKATRQP